MQQFCPWEPAQYFFYSSNIPTLFFYSHIPAIIVSLIIGLLVFSKTGKSKIGVSLLVISILFSLWSIFDLIIWATNRSDIILFYWSLQVLFEPLIYLIGFYLVYLFIKNKDLIFEWKLFGFLLYLPVIILLPTKYNLIGVDITYCNAVEGFIAQYVTYIIEFIIILFILGLTILEYKKNSELAKKKEIIFFSLGVLLFLIAFSSGNIIGSFTENWELAQTGLIGMPIFVGFLSYMIVKFNIFNVKLIGSQVLIFTLGFLVFSILFIRRIENVRIVVIFTLFFVVVLGLALIKSIKKEIKSKENEELQHKKFEKLSIELADSNEKLKSLDDLKNEFLSLATHQLRSPITAIKGYSSMLLDGSYGSITEIQKDPTDKIFKSSERMNHMITRFLDVVKIEKGAMQYTKQPFEFEKMVGEIVNELSVTAEKKGLSVSFQTDNLPAQAGKSPYMVNADREQLWQVVQNLIDNSIKYTKVGWIKIKLTKDEKKNKVLFAISDSGMGIKPEILPTLFQKFNRGEGNKMNTAGSGLGLYLAKEIVENGHQGKIWAESEGTDKGSVFYVELDAVK